MSALAIPYSRKFEADAKGAKSFDIEIKWKVSNQNDVPVWVDAAIIVIHRRGKRTPFFTTVYDEAWVMYHPAEGFVTDFSQQRHALDLSVDVGQAVSESLGFIMGGGRGSTMYNRPNRRFDVDPYTHCIIKRPRVHVIKGRGNVRYGVGAAVEVPPRSTIEYTPILSIPGPEASDGMAEFWGNYDDPDFDVDIRIIELAHYGQPAAPPSRTSGPVIGQEMLREAFELKLKERMFIRPRFEVDVAPVQPRFIFDVAPTPRWEKRIWDPISETWI